MSHEASQEMCVCVFVCIVKEKEDIRQMIYNRAAEDDTINIKKEYIN